MVGFMKENLVEQQDKQYVWHPFTQMQGWLENQQTVICEAKGIKLTDTEGRSYYDGVSSLWVNIHGHQRREIDEAIIAQLGKVAHSTALGLANIPAAELAEQLVALAPDGLEKVFYSDDGSTAVEVALKMSFQYWRHQGQPKKEKFVPQDPVEEVGFVAVAGLARARDSEFNPPNGGCRFCRSIRSRLRVSGRRASASRLVHWKGLTPASV